MKSTKGFGVLQIILLVVVVGIVSGVGFYVYTSNKQTTETLNNADKSNSVTTEKYINATGNQPKAVDENVTKSPYIKEVDITLQTPDDVSKLPEFTPASFKSYMTDVLKNNVFTTNKDYINIYKISLISDVNIRGGNTSVDKTSSYIGGAPAIWVLNPKGSWDEETLNGPVCKSKNGGLIYEEFVSQCATDSGDQPWIKNPNGSISQLY